MRALEVWDGMATSLPPPLRGGFWHDARRRSVRASANPPEESRASTSTASLTPLLANLRELASERDLSKLLALITNGAVALARAERGFVLLVGDDGALEPATIQSAESELGTQTAAFSRSIAETVLIDGEPVITVDAARDARVSDYMSVHQLMLKSVACLPIETRGRSWGVLLCALLAFGYYALLTFGQALALRGTISETAALWLPNAAFAGTAWVLLRRAGRTPASA